MKLRRTRAICASAVAAAAIAGGISTAQWSSASDTATHGKLAEEEVFVPEEFGSLTLTGYERVDPSHAVLRYEDLKRSTFVRISVMPAADGSLTYTVFAPISDAETRRSAVARVGEAKRASESSKPQSGVIRLSEIDSHRRVKTATNTSAGPPHFTSPLTAVRRLGGFGEVSAAAGLYNDREPVVCVGRNADAGEGFQAGCAGTLRSAGAEALLMFAGSSLGTTAITTSEVAAVTAQGADGATSLALLGRDGRSSTHAWHAAEELTVYETVTLTYHDGTRETVEVA